MLIHLVQEGLLNKLQVTEAVSQGAKVLVGSAAAGFNLSTAQLQEVDETTITFNYGGGHKAVSNGGSDKFYLY